MAKLFFISMIVMLLLNLAAAILVPYPFSRQILLQSPASGPDSVAFTQNNQTVAYVTINDGRVLRLFVKTGAFEDFAYTSSLRTKEQCDGNNNPNLAPICGKVFGLSVDNVNQILYAVDANLGLYSIDIATGGLATFITNTADGKQFKLSSGIDVDPTSGDVYFTDASQTLDYRNITPPTNIAFDSTGRLLKYNPKTKDVTVVLSELYFPQGPAVSIDGTFVLIPQIGDKNILKYYIKEQKTVVLLTLPGTPRKIKRASTPGYFWVAVNIQTTAAAGQPSIRKPIAYKFDSFGNVLIKKDLSPQYPNVFASVIQEINPLTIFVGSRATNYITRYSVL